MKRCKYCGRDNLDDATRCGECGVELSATTDVEDAAVPVERIALLQSEVEAELIDAELTSRNIPHSVVSYRDSAFDGLFQLYRGWGHLEAPCEFKDNILSILQAIRQSASESEKNATQSPDGNPSG